MLFRLINPDVKNGIVVSCAIAHVDILKQIKLFLLLGFYARNAES